MWNNCDKYFQTWLWLQEMLPWILLSISAKNPQGSLHGSPHLLLKVKDWFLEKPFKFQVSYGFLQILQLILPHYHVLQGATVSDLQAKSTAFHSKWEVIFGRFSILRKRNYLNFFRIVVVFFKRLLPVKQKIVGEKLRILMRGPWNLLSLKFQDLLMIWIIRIKVAMMTKTRKCWTQLTRHVLLSKQKAKGSWVRGMDHLTGVLSFIIFFSEFTSRHTIDSQEA